MRRSKHGPHVPDDWKQIDSGGPRPFVSWISYQLPDQSQYVWESRHHRKGSGPRWGYADRVGLRTTRRAQRTPNRSPWLRFWAPHRLAWWIASAFMVGSLFFVAGAAGSLVPEIFGGQHPMTIFSETCYFVGAALYTVSIYGQVLETLNADRSIAPDRSTRAPDRFRWFAFELTRLDFLVPFILLLGSLVFNYETLVSLAAVFDVLPKLGLWSTSLLGAALFLVSGFLQLIEASHGYFTFNPRNVSCWIGALFVVGSLGFIVGSLPGIASSGLPTAESEYGSVIVKVGFLVGGVAYLVGSYLMLPELFTQLQEHSASRANAARPASPTTN